MAEGQATQSRAYQLRARAEEIRTIRPDNAVRRTSKHDASDGGNV
jgi:hypothetical protein